MCAPFKYTFRYLTKRAKMSKSECNTNYDGAIYMLNKLQTNAQYIRDTPLQKGKENFSHMKKYLERSGLTLEQLDKLSVIHVAGTKGKGTTCAFSESILRHHGLKTGFYSSPHLLEVRERIRINGNPITKDEFAKCYWKLFDELEHKKSYPDDMPAYFRFLTLMAFHIFLEQKVDVAIIEVGIGGEYDCTNILRKVSVAGITSLGIDHVTLLGDTLESIAWNKAGIMKKDSHVFVVPQPENAMKVLQERSKERKCSLTVVDNNLPSNLKFSFTSPSEVLKANASLALALTQTWMTLNRKDLKFSLETATQGLENCVWPGRYQIKEIDNIRYYLDGAHTNESISVCANWYKEMTKNSNRKQVLLFNVTGGRNTEKLLNFLRICEFSKVLFVPNLATAAENNPAYSNFIDTDKQMKRCQENLQVWQTLDEQYNSVKPTEMVQVFPSILDALHSLDTNEQYDMLITGSIHLVGCALSVLDPNLNGILTES